MDLNDKIGYACFHDMGDPAGQNNLERCLDFCVQAGVKYMRPAFALQDNEYNSGKAWGWRIDPYKKIINAGLKVIFGAYPQQLVGHAYDSDIGDMVDKAITAYANILDNILNNGISPDDVIVEAWNEADGINFFLTSKDGSDAYSKSHTDPKVIQTYLDFNMKLCREAHNRGFEFMDLCSVKYPGFDEFETMLKMYDEQMTMYGAKPEYMSWHPYVERQAENSIPESYLTTFSLDKYSNLADIPLAVSEFGLPAVEWGHPFSGSWPLQYSRDILIRQIIIMDYLGVSPMIIYSGNTNPDQSEANADSCWGVYQYHKDTNSIDMTGLGKVELRFLQEMKGYHLVGMVSPSSHYTFTKTNVGFTNFAFEYRNNNGRSKLFYWNPFGNSQSSVAWNGTIYDLKFSQHVKTIEVDTVQPDKPTDNAPLNLTACYTDKAKYQASDTATVNLEFNNQGNNMRSLAVAIDGNTPTGDTVSLATTAINIPAGKSKSSVSFKLPSQDNTSYLLQIAVLENDIPQATQTIGLDVGDSWTDTPRYAALTNFNPSDQTSKDNISDDIATLNKFNINATMYYDGYYRPQNTIPSDNYQTWIGENVSKDLLQKGVDTNHQYGMQAMLYNMINATTGTPDDTDTAMSNSELFGSTITRQDGTKGIASKMGVFRTGKCNECPVPGTFDGLGEQATYNMLGSYNDRDDVDHKVQYYYNPADSDWQNYIGNIMKNSLALIGFDGWQGDTIGDIYGVPYEDKGTNNNAFHTMDTYASFINAVKPTYFADKTLGMNAVNYGGQDKLNSSKADFNYAELWQSNEPTYEDLAQCIRTTASSSSKPLIVPSYMYHDWYNSGSSDFPSQFKDATILIKDAVIFANGGAPMELVDNGYQLPTEYYPDTRTHYKIMMSDTLGNPDNGLLRKMYDFVTAYSSLLYPANHTKNLIYITDGNGNHVNSSTAAAGKVYDVTTNQNGVDVLQLVNLTGCSNINWQINNKSDEDSKNITPTGQLTIKMYTNNTGTLYGASYEDGMRNEYSYTTGSDSNGSYITFTIDSLDLWSIFYITK